ncbi:MAG: type II toxin-antitoxin system HigB family toxin [Alkalimonas sp.]|nr:type II toxin-antitoxin system HigB family toxin [Alkalimonas sp.]
MQGAFIRWIQILKTVDWYKTEDIRRTFPSVDFLGNDSNRLIFNIGGNKHRMICTYKFGVNNVHLFVKWIGTHAEYDKLCDKNEQYTVDIN